MNLLSSMLFIKNTSFLLTIQLKQKILYYLIYILKLAARNLLSPFPQKKGKKNNQKYFSGKVLEMAN